MWNLKKKVQMNLFTKQKYSYGCRKQTRGYQGIRGGGINWEIGIDIYTLLYIKYITNIDSYLFSLYIAQGTLLNTL